MQKMCIISALFQKAKQEKSRIAIIINFCHQSVNSETYVHVKRNVAVYFVSWKPIGVAQINLEFFKKFV